MPIDPIHIAGTPENKQVQAIDVRLYFPVDMTRREMLDQINEGLQAAEHMPDFISAYELVDDGFGRLVPDDKPLA